MKVTNNRVLVKILPAPQKKIGNLVVPDTSSSEGIEYAEVLAISTDEKELEVGDKVVIYKGCGKEFTEPETQEKVRTINISEVLEIYGK